MNDWKLPNTTETREKQSDFFSVYPDSEQAVGGRRHDMPLPPASCQLFTNWHLFPHVGYLRHQQQVDL